MFNKDDSMMTGDEVFETEQRATELAELIEGMLENEQRQLLEIDKIRQGLVTLERARGQEIENMRQEKVDIEAMRRNEADRYSIILQNKEDEKNRDIIIARQKVKEEYEAKIAGVQLDADRRLSEELDNLRAELKADYAARRKDEMTEVNKRVNQMLEEHQSMLAEIISKINAASSTLSDNAAAKVGSMIDSMPQTVASAPTPAVTPQPIQEVQPVQQQAPEVVQPVVFTEQPPQQPAQNAATDAPQEDKEMESELDKISELFKLQEQRMKKMSEFLN